MLGGMTGHTPSRHAHKLGTLILNPPGFVWGGWPMQTFVQVGEARALLGRPWGSAGDGEGRRVGWEVQNRPESPTHTQPQQGWKTQTLGLFIATS